MTKDGRVDVVHLVPHPVAGLRFVAPLVMALEDEGCRAELWVQLIPGLDSFFKAIPCAKRAAVFNLSLNVWQMLRGLWGLWRDFRRIRPRCVVAHMTRGALIPLLAARMAGVRLCIYHNHGIPYLGYRGLFRFALQRLEQVNIGLADMTFTVSHAMRDAYVRDGLLQPESCILIGAGSACGIDLQKYCQCTEAAAKPLFKRSVHMGEQDFVVLYVGRAYRRKGFDLVLQAWNLYFRDRDDMHLLLAGCSELDIRRVLGLMLPKNVHAVGYVDDPQPLYSAADVVVLPSEHEGFGYALLEGAASACCLIATDIPGPDELVRDGETGFRIAVGDVDGLAQRISLLREDRALRASMANSARLMAMAFDRRIFIPEYKKVMCDYLKRSN